MNWDMLPYMLIYLSGVFLSSMSQILLKKSACMNHKSILHEYLNWRVIFGYGIFFGCTLLTVISYRKLPVNMGPILETAGYVFVTIEGAIFFSERVTKKKLVSLITIVAGILVYSI